MERSASVSTLSPHPPSLTQLCVHVQESCWRETCDLRTRLFVVVVALSFVHCAVMIGSTATPKTYQ